VSSVFISSLPTVLHGLLTLSSQSFIFLRLCYKISSLKIKQR
jgi:hypothetical protein